METSLLKQEKHKSHCNVTSHQSYSPPFFSQAFIKATGKLTTKKMLLLSHFFFLLHTTMQNSPTQVSCHVLKPDQLTLSTTGQCPFLLSWENLLK